MSSGSEPQKARASRPASSRNNGSLPHGRRAPDGVEQFAVQRVRVAALRERAVAAGDEGLAFALAQSGLTQQPLKVALGRSTRCTLASLSRSSRISRYVGSAISRRLPAPVPARAVPDTLRPGRAMRCMRPLGKIIPKG